MLVSFRNLVHQYRKYEVTMKIACVRIRSGGVLDVVAVDTEIRKSTHTISLYCQVSIELFIDYVIELLAKKNL